VRPAQIRLGINSGHSRTVSALKAATVGMQSSTLIPHAPFDTSDAENRFRGGATSVAHLVWRWRQHQLTCLPCQTILLGLLLLSLVLRQRPPITWRSARRPYARMGNARSLTLDGGRTEATRAQVHRATRVTALSP
jgi:hypothetical protein